ncbi:MAG: hypothetical protein ACT4QF_05700 [Sporichthyaceae bacterium]|jgi:hypothetical protein
MGDEEYLTILRSEYRRVEVERTLPGRWHRAKGRLASSAGSDAALCEHCWQPVGTHFSTIAPSTKLGAWRWSDWTWAVVLTAAVVTLGWAFATRGLGLG